MSRIARCPKCKCPLVGIDKTPTQLKREADAAAAAERRHRREIEAEVRKWYAADFKIVYDAVMRTKLRQVKNPQSKPLFESILKTHADRLEELEREIADKVALRLKKGR
jgi:hypothetical protein